MQKNVEHIDRIDGAKGVSIIAVILLHCMPDLDKIYSFLHISQAVPVFVFITAYLLTLHYKSFKEYYRRERLRKMLRRVLPPFLIATLCVSAVHWVHFGALPSVKALVFMGGCLGPGSYYLSIYLSDDAVHHRICPTDSSVVFVPCDVADIHPMRVRICGNMGIFAYPSNLQVVCRALSYGRLVRMCL